MNACDVGAGEVVKAAPTVILERYLIAHLNLEPLREEKACAVLMPARELWIGLR